MTRHVISSLRVFSVVDDICIIHVDCKDQWVATKLDTLHDKLSLYFGSFAEELPEQKMAVKYLTGDEKVLELGGNIGRNSLIISKVLKESSQMVVMETDPHIADLLRYNKSINGLKFHVENAGLSAKPLIQNGWVTEVSDVVPEGYIPVRTITFYELNQKYNIEFDTLVLDCEGAFYYILQDMPEILTNIKIIIMENDYNDINHKHYIDNVLRSRGFSVIHSEAGGWGCCEEFFFQVWKREVA